MPQRPVRGRPARIDAEAIRHVALALFLERGFDRVSTTEIAEAAGISRSSLARFYPTKQQIVWEGQDDLAERIARSLDEHETGTLEERIAASIVAALDYSEEDLAILRRRLRLVDANPDLQVKRAFGRDPVAQVLKLFISQNSPTRLNDDELELVSSLYAGATDMALLLWSRTDDPGPHQAVLAGLRLVALP
jgi:AcrR family transcriptional regulator